MSEDSPSEDIAQEAEHVVTVVKHSLRHWYLFAGAAIVLVLLALVDPDVGVVQSLPVGGSTVAWLIQVLRGLFVVTLCYITLSSLLDFDPEADLLKLIKKANDTEVGSGLAAIALAIIFVGLVSAFNVK